MKSSNRIPRHDWKNHTKFVTLNATFRILKVNATGNGHRGCIYFENLQLNPDLVKFMCNPLTIQLFLLIITLYRLKWKRQ